MLNDDVFTIVDPIDPRFVPEPMEGTKSVFVVAPLSKHYLGQHDQSTHGNWAHGAVSDFADTKNFKDAVAEIVKLNDNNYLYSQEFADSPIGQEFRKTVQDRYPSAKWDSQFNRFKSNSGGFELPRDSAVIAYEAMKERLRIEVNKTKGFAQYKDSFEEYVPDIISLQNNSKVCVAMDASSFINLLNSDEFKLKTQFETATSNGFYDPLIRKAGEMAGQSIPIDTPNSKRPIYGYLAPSDFPDDITNSGVSQYGEVRIVLKDSVKDRTTMTIGDSLNTGAIPMSMTHKPTGFDVWKATDSRNQIHHNILDGIAPEDIVNDDYFEAQIHDGVKASDIESIQLPNAMQDEIFLKKIPAGIKVDFWDSYY